MKFLVHCFCLLTALYAQGQNITLENLDQRTLYAGVRNSLKMGTSGVACPEITVHCSNGTFEKDSCRLEVIPEKEGLLVLTFYLIHNGDSLFLDSRKYSVSRIKDPEPHLYHKTSGKMRRDLILRGSLELENTQYYLVGCGITLPIREFKILATRNNEWIGHEFNPGASLTDESKSLIKNLKPGDRILYYDIIGMNYYQEYVNLGTLDFEIH
ncbi:MAG TPA: hypothetical protein DCG19_11420 [Cryomorphaceae bacterium]|nr:hypothetical protein [Owenweeksia sp.]MBG00628.1 hypothetical protein [Owenweeksia sp.]HAD98007.1 hypothetical protein [Cryomorphaceae bacterium]HBF21085.1 hypothetical protein [Cryomorphaceae bacterium]HCQ15491.1 hypothetical protein [Cryomorphaceae bacterium]